MTKTEVPAEKRDTGSDLSVGYGGKMWPSVWVRWWSPCCDHRDRGRHTPQPHVNPPDCQELVIYVYFFTNVILFKTSTEFEIWHWHWMRTWDYCHALLSCAVITCLPACLSACLPADLRTMLCILMSCFVFPPTVLLISCIATLFGCLLTCMKLNFAFCILHFVLKCA